jgi:hypothetical protein
LIWGVGGGILSGKAFQESSIMHMLFFSLAIGFGVFMLTSVVVWVFRIQRYIELHGGRSASVVFNGAIWRDYLTARRIADKAGHKPSFLVLFQTTAVMAAAFFVAGVLTLLIEGLR